MPYIPKSTKATTDSYPFTFDYTGWPQLATDDIVSATASATPSGLTVGSPTVGTGDDAEKVFVNLSSGTSGTTYRVTVIATTSGGSTLTGYLDLLVSDAALAGVTIYPSLFGPYIDTRRAMQLLYDDGELSDDEDAPTWTTIDGNNHAMALAQYAWMHLQGATRRGNIYGGRELIDLANDQVRGQDLIGLLADIFWCQLIKRRRYVENEPQGKDPSCERAEMMLEQLRQGVRIFVLDGVAVTDDSGASTGTTYTNVMGPPTAMVEGLFGSDPNCPDPARRFWGCTDRCSSATARYRPRYDCC